MNGFSKYDKNGNVVYSESMSVGKKVRHFYSYDEFNRRIHYKREYSNGDIFQEHTKYHQNGSKEITSINLPLCNICTRRYNNLGRLIEEESQDKNGNCIRRLYDYSTDTYITTKFKHPFTYIL